MGWADFTEKDTSDFIKNMIYFDGIWNNLVINLISAINFIIIQQIQMSLKLYSPLNIVAAGCKVEVLLRFFEFEV